MLGSVSPEKNSASALSLSNMQADLAKKAAAWLSENLERQVSVSELSGRFHVSKTHLQNAFKGVYGVPVSSYIRVLKMQSAALRLIHTDTSILDVAAEFGYSNAGKFASAFHKIMGETPGKYRKLHGISQMQLKMLPSSAVLNSAVLEYFSVLMERKGRRKGAIILLCLVRGFYF